MAPSNLLNNPISRLGPLDGPILPLVLILKKPGSGIIPLCGLHDDTCCVLLCVVADVVL